MKKVIAIIALAFVAMSCGSQSSTESVNDSTAVANDTATVAVDSAAVSSDSTEAVK
jgi:PBP1b-binding outer membrane lipoprotein LpoB